MTHAELTTKSAAVVDVFFVPGHFNPRAFANIPDSWVAIRKDGQRFYGDTEEEAIEAAGTA